MKQHLFPMICALCLLPLAAFGQMKEPVQKPVSFASVLQGSGQQSPGLLGLIGFDRSRFSMTQSYSISYGALGGHRLSQGIYLNTMSYQLTRPLSVNLEWGMAHTPLQSQGLQALQPSGLFLSNASLHYNPTKNLSIGVSYSNMPYGYYNTSSGLQSSRTRLSPFRY